MKIISIRFIEFMNKKRLWLKMTHIDQEYAAVIDSLERKFAVSNNVFKKFNPIFRDIFIDPDNDKPRPARSRKQPRPPCNSKELHKFCWTLYCLVKGML